MGKFLFAVVVAVASLAVVESITCNQCAFNLLGQCIGQGNATCSSNSSVCYTDRYTFSLFSNRMTINSTSCRQTNATCGGSFNGNVMTVMNMMTFTYNVTTECCFTDNCNQLFTNAAPSAERTFTVASSGALLASVWGSFL